MARKLIVMLMSVMILVGFASCDLSDMMKAMGKNVAGANPGKVGKVEEAIDSIWGDEGSGGAKQTSDGVMIGNVDLGDFATDVDTYLAALDDESFSSLVSTIAKAAANEEGKKSLQNSLSQPLDPEDEKDNEKIEATKGSATIITNMIEEITGEKGLEAVKEALNSATDDNGMPDELRTLFYNLADGLYAIAEYSGGQDEVISSGDVVIMQTVYTVLNNVSDVIFTDGPVDDTTGLPPMNDDITQDTEALSGLIDQVNIGIQIIDAVAPASSFGDLQLDDILKDLLSSMNSGSEGGSN